MSSTHPTNITTEWDDLQRKHGNLPKIVPQKTSEQESCELVEALEFKLLREARLARLKKQMAQTGPIYAAPVSVTIENFVKEVTEASKCPQASDESLQIAGGIYIPVLLLHDGPDKPLLKQGWQQLSRRYPRVKFTMGSAMQILKSSTPNVSAPSSILLYFGGTCILQKCASAALEVHGYDYATRDIIDRVADAMEIILNSVPGHVALSLQDSDSDDSNLDDENERRDGCSKMLEKLGISSSDRCYTLSFSRATRL
ncbi:hypothetical protein BdWA1_001257 [Babesia duncani]|uniref:Phosducin thioredoxin-like domain-containing protein n=1 Tax=Babesia duncani TaxID=323732 RepID=A0AAD9UQL0_9APIC|nr:hypothetical protein BdWA1_001257 [Babesia duncani]